MSDLTHYEKTVAERIRLVAEYDPPDMAGVIGGGGLGDLAIRYGYQRFNNEVMFGTVLILVAMVQGVQMAGDRLVRSLAHRR